MVSKEIYPAKIVAEKCNHQVSFGISFGDSVVIQPQGNRCIAECELPLRFCLSCQCWLYQCVIDLYPFFISLIHQHWFNKGLLFDLSIIFDKMLKLVISTKESSEQLTSTMDNETVEILSDKNNINAPIKPRSGDRFTRDGVDLLHSTTLSLLDFHKSIQDSHRA